MDVKALLILKCFCLLILYFNPIVEGDTPYGTCANPECSVPVGKGITILRYASPDDYKISVEPNEEVVIFVKDYGPKKDLWGIVVRGSRGYISKSFIRETQSFMKILVPANVEFKTTVLVTSDYTVTSHLHTSSYYHQPNSLSSNTVPEPIIHTQTFQQDFVNSIPNSHQQVWNSPSESLQASHLSSNFDPNSNVQFGFHSNFEQSSQLYPEYSSHFHSDPGNNFDPSHVTGMKSENILPSQSHVPNIGDPSLYQENPLLFSTYPESEQKNMPNFDSVNMLNVLHGESFDPNSVYPSQTYQSFNQHPSGVQQQEFQSPYAPEMHSSFYSDYFDPLSNDDLSKTFAMLNDMGFGDSYMYSDSYSESQDHQSSQNIKADFHTNEVEFNAVPSLSQYPLIQSNDVSLLSSINPNPSVSVYSETVNSEAQTENINNLQDTYIEAENDISHKIPVVKDLEIEKAKSEPEELAEINDGTEDEDYEEEEEEEEEDTSVVNGIVSSVKSTENSETEFPLKSSMSSTLTSEQNSKFYKDVQSSMENSIIDSNLVQTLHIKHNTLVKEEITRNKEISPGNEPMQPDPKILEDGVVMHTVVQTTIDKHGEFSDDSNLTKNNVVDIHEVMPNIFNPDKDKSPVDSDASEKENLKVVNEPPSKKDVSSDISIRNNNDALQTESTMYDQEHTTPPVNDFFIKSDQNSELNQILNTIDIDGVGDGVRSTYQIRNLKGEYTTTEEQQPDSEAVNDENNTDTDDYNSFENGLNALKSFVDFIMSWIPEPLYSVLMDLQNKGISPRVPVFTAMCGIICIFLIVPLFYIKEWSKESRLSTQLASVEKNLYTLSATNTILEEKLESVQSELSILQGSLNEEKTSSESLKSEFESQGEELDNIKAELQSCLEELDSLKEKENEYLSLLNDHEKEKENLLEHKSSLDKIITDQENSIASLNDQLEETEDNIKELEKEKIQFLQMKEDYEEKIALFDRNCNQLLQEAEVWNLRVKELSSKVNEEETLKENLEASLREKNEEIESLKQLVETFKTFEEIEDLEDEAKSKEDKLQSLINSSMILNQLKKEEDKNKVLEEQLGKEKNKILDIEVSVELLDAKSEIDKLKMSYNQALQDKAEAQTKLDVLTNYFKDKEIQLQRQLGAQEAVRQKKEEDANSAERRICLIEQENASYKYQVASMKQEMEETERNLKSQIAAQEKKAHENWIAARAAERKLEDMKQEITQLRQRLTLLEREQENWANSSRDDIIRPVPKRIPGVNEESSTQDMNVSERGMFPPPPLHDRLPPMPPPMLLPPDRPLPPLPPPMFLPPMERHFRQQPWHLPPDPSSDYRTTPPEFIGGRESTPPRGRQSTITDGDTGPNTSSPLTTDTRDSRNSTPPHLLPDFHDVPPQPGRPFFPPPPPLGHPRLPMHPPYRRDPLSKRLENSNEFNSRGSQQPPPQEQWQHSRV